MAASPTRPPSSSSAELAPLGRILVVEDDEAKRYVLTRTLRSAGYEVSEANSGLAALRLAHAGIDLVVLDLHLPDLDGIGVTRRMKADPTLARVPVLQVSATLVNDGERAHGLNSGADAYLTTPLEPEVLLAQVGALLRARRTDDERLRALEAARKQAEDLAAQLQASEARLRMTIETTRVVSWEYDVATGRVRWSPNAEAVHGIPEGKLAGSLSAYQDMVHPEDRAALQLRLERALEGGGSFVSEHRTLRADGSVMWIYASGTVARDASGRPVLLSGIGVDITDRRRAEERALRLQAVTSALLRALTPGEVASRILREAMEGLGASGGLVYVAHADGKLHLLQQVGLASLSGYEVVPLSADQPSPEAVRTGKPIWIESPELFAGRYLGMAAEVAAVSSNRAWAVLPLLTEARAVGSMVLSFAEQRRFSPEDRAFAMTLAQQCSLALERARLYAEERHARSQLQVGEERIRLALSSRGLGAWELDVLQKRVLLDARSREIFGLQEAELPVRIFSEVIHPEDRASIDAAARSSVTFGRGQQGDIQYRLAPDAQGHARWVSSSWRTLQEGGRVTRVFGTVEDITAQKRAEEASAFLARASTVLISAINYEETLQRIAQLAVPQLGDWTALDVLQEEGRLHRVAVFHQDPEMVRFGQEYFARYPPRLDEPSGIGAVARTGNPDFYPYMTPAEVDASARDAEQLEILRRLKPCSYIAVPLVVQRRILGVLSFVYAESGRHHRREDLELATALAERAAVALDSARLFEAANRERQRAEEANRAKDEFLAVVSHELRTPLTAILGYSSMLRSGGMAEARRARAIEVIERNARTQAQLIDDLLDISRIITGKLRLERRPTVLPRVIEAALDAVRPAAEAKEIALTSSLQPAFDPIHADPDRIQQVVWNLLSNAIKFTPRGGRVTVELRSLEGQLELEVSDNGQGIPPEFLPSVFERFRQADTRMTRRQGGLGLGLAIVRHLVELHGGSVEAHSGGLGQGARFVVRLPCAVPRTTPAPGSVPSIPAAEPAEFALADLAGLHVLVVDDEPDAREMIGSLLAISGAQVTAASSAAEALEALARGLPDVLVSDIGMPDEDGYSLIRKVRKLVAERGARLPAIALTAYARAEDRARALLAGYTMHVTKPIEPMELVATVASAVGRTAREG